MINDGIEMVLQVIVYNTEQLCINEFLHCASDKGILNYSSSTACPIWALEVIRIGPFPFPSWRIDFLVFILCCSMFVFLMRQKCRSIGLCPTVGVGIIIQTFV